MFRQVCIVFVVSYLFFCAVSLGDDSQEEYAKLLGSSGEIYVMEYLKTQGYKVIPYPGKEPLGVVGAAIRDVWYKKDYGAIKEVIFYESILTRKNTLEGRDTFVFYHPNLDKSSDVPMPKLEKSQLGEDWLEAWVKSMTESNEITQWSVGSILQEEIDDKGLDALCQVHFIDALGDRYIIYQNIDDIKSIKKYKTEEKGLRAFSYFIGDRLRSKEMQNFCKELEKLPYESIKWIIHID